VDTNVTCGAAACGNGKVEANEQCDDGNKNNNDGCSSACKKEGCGDGIIQPPEECDGSAPVDYICNACKLVHEPKVCQLKVKYTIKVENTGSGDCTADDIQVKEVMTNVTRSIYPRSTNNQLSIGTLHPGQKKESSITIDIDPTKCTTAKKPGFIAASYGLTTNIRESTELCP
jgi:cysteine-rich repeat protein